MDSENWQWTSAMDRNAVGTPRYRYRKRLRFQEEEVEVHNPSPSQHPHFAPLIESKGTTFDRRRPETAMAMMIVSGGDDQMVVCEDFR